MVKIKKIGFNYKKRFPRQVMHDQGSTDFLKSFALLFSDLGADLGGAKNIFLSFKIK